MTPATGTRVRLRPRPGGDVWDIALAGRTAVVQAVEETLEGELLLAVVVEGDPGGDLPGHRFFFTPAEVEPLRVLIAGIGNVFLGDDGFGVTLAQRLARRELPEGVDIVDYGIRGMDLAYALADYDAVILLDAAPRGGEPGTLYVIEPEIEAIEPVMDAHGMDPVKVLGLSRALGSAPPRALVLGCEPQTRMSGDEDEVVAELTAPVEAALDEAERLVESLLEEVMRGDPR
jgi:hydrogenase maturation protease